MELLPNVQHVSPGRVKMQILKAWVAFRVLVKVLDIITRAQASRVK